MPQFLGAQSRDESRQLRGPVMWGIVWGGIQAASPLAFWWLDPATVYALGLVLIASVYIGFAVADGRWLVIAFETNVAAIFVIVAAAAITQIAMAARCRPCGSRAQGPLAAPKSFRGEHAVVAALLPRGRRGRRHHHCRRDRGRRFVPQLVELRSLRGVRVWL